MSFSPAELDAYKRVAEALKVDKVDKGDLKEVSPKPVWSKNKFLGQRNTHRTVLFYFSLITSIISLLGLFLLITIQLYFRVTLKQDFEVISDRGLEIFAVSIFGQVFGVVYIIAKSVWNSWEFGLITKDGEKDR